MTAVLVAAIAAAETLPVLTVAVALVLISAPTVLPAMRQVSTRHALRRSVRGPGWRWLAAALIVSLVVVFVKTLQGGDLRSAVATSLGTAPVLVCAVAGASWTAAPLDRRRALLAWGSVLAAVAMASASVIGWIADPRVRVSGWHADPNVWAASAVLPALIPLALGRRNAIAATAVLGGVITIVLAGSRTALVGFAFGGLGLTLLAGFRRDAARRWAWILAIVVLAAVGAALQGPRWAPLAHVLRDEEHLQELLDGTPAGNVLSSRGQALGVKLIGKGANAASEAGAMLEKTATPGWSRLQYQAVLIPGTIYTLSAELKALSPSQQVGLLGVGQVRSPRSRPRLEFAARAGTVAEGSDGILILTTAVEPLEDGWQRVVVTFRYAGVSRCRWWIGPAPDLQDGTLGARAAARRLMLAIGHDPAPFTVPGTGDLAARQALDRVAAFRAAWSGFLTRPWFGQPLGSFRDYARRTTLTAVDTDVRHAHDLALQTLFETGVFGGLALALLLTGLALLSRAAGVGFLVLFLTILLLNLADLTLWSSGQALVLAGAAALVRRDGP